MKKKLVFIVLTLAIFAINGCQKEEMVAPKHENVSNNYVEALYVNDLVYEKTLLVYDDSRENSVELKISSNSQELLDYYMKIQAIQLVVSSSKVGENPIESGSKNNLVALDESDIKLPDNCLSFEVINENIHDENLNYSIRYGKKELKSYPNPPDNYYSFIKYSVRENAKINYFPNDTETDELYYKWAYTNSWIGKWYEDTYWRYVWGFDAVDSPMYIYHPLNNTGTYRLGIKIYYDDPNCFYAESY